MLTRFIGPSDREKLQARFERDLEGDVRLLLFVQPPSGLYIPGREEPQTGRQTQQLLQEVESLSPKLHLEVHNPRLEPELAQHYAIDRTPALILLPGVRDKRQEASEEADEPAGDEAPPPAGGMGPHHASRITHDSGPRGGVRFFGLPSGYEFGSLLEDIVDVSRGQTRLSEATRQALAALPAPLHLRVFVTPT